MTEGSGWFVKEVEVDLPTKGKHYFFKCDSWLARDKGDGQTSRVFTLDEGETSVVSYKPRKFIPVFSSCKTFIQLTVYSVVGVSIGICLYGARIAKWSPKGRTTLPPLTSLFAFL